MMVSKKSQTREQLYFVRYRLNSFKKFREIKCPELTIVLFAFRVETFFFAYTWNMASKKGIGSDRHSFQESHSFPIEKILPS